MKLKDRVALVTGGARRVGRAIALDLARAGATVAVHYLSSKENAEKTVEDIRSEGGKASLFQADLTSSSAPEGLIGAVVDEIGIPSILVNSAARFGAGTVAGTGAEDFDGHMALNTRAPMLLMSAFARFLGRQDGAVVNLSDWRALRPGRKHVAYTLSKAALESLTVMAAREWAPLIRVNSLALGIVLGPEGEEEGETARVLEKTPTGRAVRLEEVTGAVRFLLENDSVVGTILTLDGGAHLNG